MLVTVPDVVGLSQSNAESAIVAAGLTVGGVTTQNSDTVPAGDVISQDPVAGTSVTIGSGVDIVVSLGPVLVTVPESDVTVEASRPRTATPACRSRTLTSSSRWAPSCDSAIVAAGLVVGNVTFDYSDTVPAGDVISQNPVAGADLAIGSTVDIVVSLGSLIIDTDPPVVAISSPAADAILTSPTDIIGTADDPNLVLYELSLVNPTDGSVTPFASNTIPVVAGVLGQLDTALQQNGIFRLRLEAVDVNGNTASTDRVIVIDDEGKIGDFTLTFTDLQVPVSGIPITLNRIYSSMARSRSQDFGHGWKLEVVKAGEYTNNRKPGDGWVITSGGGFLNPPCTNSNSTKTHITEIRFSELEFYRFAFQVQMFGFGSAITGGCIGTSSFGQIGGIPGATLQAIGSNAVFWQNGTDSVTFDLGDPDFGLVYEPEDVRLTTRDGRVFDLNLSDGLTRIGDPNGNSLFIGSGGVTHSSGKSITFTRDGQGRITAITDPMGQTIAYGYDVVGDLVTVADRGGNTTTINYDGAHLLLDLIDPLGNMPLRTEYDSNGRQIAQIDADGNRTEFAYDLTANTTTVADRLGNITSVQYNDDGLVTDAQSGGSTTQFTYDARRNKLSETDPLGNTGTFAYSASDDLLSRTDPLGNTTLYTYDSAGRVTSITDADGNANSYTYDAKGNLLEARDANSVVTKAITYDASGNPTQITTLGGTTNFTYDAFGNVVTELGPAGQDKGLTYDANGNRLTETAMRTVGGVVVAETTTFAYDGNGNLVSETDPLGNVTTFTYDANRQILTRPIPLATPRLLSMTVAATCSARTFRMEPSEPPATTWKTANRRRRIGQVAQPSSSTTPRAGLPGPCSPTAPTLLTPMTSEET